MDIGQINYEDNALGQHIVRLSSLPEVKNIVEIGTWNGLGTTRCVLHGISIGPEKKYDFYSIECSSECYIEAINNNCKHINKNIHFIYGKIIDETQLSSWFDINILTEEQRGWLLQDFTWMSRVPNVLDKLPNSIDLLILDGGEFSTYLEWNTLKNISNFVALDDTTQLKCCKIRQEVIESNNWEIIEDCPTGSKNGFMVIKNIKNNEKN